MGRKELLKKFEDNKDFFENTVYPNIEKYRKGNMKIKVVDEKGQALDNAKIKVTQKSHEFRFGANLFLLDELETDEKNSAYKESFKNVFNMATLPFYWNSTEEIKGKLRYAKDSYKFYRRPPIDLCMEFCEENGIEPREHALAYDQTFPLWLKGASVETVKTELERRYKEIAERYKDRIRTIEVTNEMCFGAGVTDFYSQPDFLEWTFKMADKYFPKNQLVINEGTEECWTADCRYVNQYYAYTEATILKGARIDAMGMQFHMFYSKEEEIKKTDKLYDPINLYDHMNLYSQLVKNLQVTEITIPAYSNDTEDEEIQAKLIEYLYTVWFSHPSMEQIIYWNLVDGYTYIYNPDKIPEVITKSQGDMTVGENIYYGGLIRYDMTPKPSYITLDNLINKKWRTELNLISDDEGSVNFRGFYGDYEIEITKDGKTVSKSFTLSSKKENTLTVTI